MARGIQLEAWRASALRDLAAALAQAGHEGAADVFREAGEVARGIPDAEKRAEALRALAAALAQANRTAEAFLTLGERGPDEFIEIVSEWRPSFERLRPGLALGVLREVVRIIGWERPDWRKIHALLTEGNGW